MNSAFIFDMDGVLVDSEHIWQVVEKPMLERVLGKDVVERIGSTIGLNATQVFEKAQQLGSLAHLDDVVAGYAVLEPDVYERAQITSGVDVLIDALVLNGFKIGLVTQSAQSAIDVVLSRLSNAAKIERTVSLFQHPKLKPKPSPDGYIEILKELNSEPKRSFILEDSNGGIQAGKSAGAFVIGFSGNLLEGYTQTGADAYAQTMKDVENVLSEQ